MASFRSPQAGCRFTPTRPFPRSRSPRAPWTRTATCSARARSSPTRPSASTRPCDAGKDLLFALRDRLGFDKNVIVQATCHGTDNRALVDALRASNGRARGVATVDRYVTDAELRAMHEAGVRGTRFNFVKRLVDFTPREVLAEIAGRIAPLGWHVVVYFEAADLPELWDFFTSLPTTVVVDHMGRPDVAKPVDGPEFELFVKLMREHDNVWSKVSCPERLSVTGSAGARRRAPRRIATWCRLPGAWWRPSRTACCGAPTGRTRT